MNTLSNSYSLADLARAGKTKLRQLSEQTFGVSTTSRTSQLLMRGNLSWALQADDEKVVSAQFQDQVIKQLEKALAKPALTHHPGTRLIREWHGQVYEVTILDKGYRWQGKTYYSLSRIAREITGSRWSGPRFFGIK